MAILSPGPYIMELEYTVAGLTHKSTHNCDVASTPTVGDDFTLIELATKGGTPVTADVWIANLVTAIETAFSSATAEFVTATLWQYSEIDNSRMFVSEYALGIPGDSAVAYRPAGQLVFTWRTSQGGIVKYNLMEASYAANDVQALGGIASGPFADLRDLFLSAGSPVLGRDNGYPIAALRVSAGENEALWRKRFRP